MSDGVKHGISDGESDEFIIEFRESVFEGRIYVVVSEGLIYSGNDGISDGVLHGAFCGTIE